MKTVSINEWDVRTAQEPDCFTTHERDVLVHRLAGTRTRLKQCYSVANPGGSLDSVELPRVSHHHKTAVYYAKLAK